jgi:hypothetical protein
LLQSLRWRASYHVLTLNKHCGKAMNKPSGTLNRLQVLRTGSLFILRNSLVKAFRTALRSAAHNGADSLVISHHAPCCRYVIEDGKLNICLRNLVDYKEYQREARLKDKQPASAAEQALMDKVYTVLSSRKHI